MDLFGPSVSSAKVDAGRWRGVGESGALCVGEAAGLE